MFETRAHQLGLTGGRSPKAMAARTRRSLAKHRAALEKLAEPYAEVDNSVAGALDELLAEFDRFEEEIEATVEWLEEEAPY